MSDVRTHLYAIYRREGELTPALVVEEARPKSSPLHSHLTWDTSAAAEKCRLIEAAQLIRSVKIRYAEGVVRDAKSVREFVSLRRIGDDDDPDASLRWTYVPTEEAMANPISAGIVLREAEREFRSFERKYGHLQEFARIVGRSAA